MPEQFLDLVKKRRSIRKFTDKPVPRNTVSYFIECAVNAPSGCDSQCWKFIAVDDKALINRLAAATAAAANEFYREGYSEATSEFLTSREKAVSFFRNAPLVIFVFLDKMEYYDQRGIDSFIAKGYNYREMNDKLAYPDILSVGAAVQNLLLAVTEQGYGACWMNDPAIADKEIRELLGVGGELRLISAIPVGEPKYSPREKKLKPIDEVLRFL